MQMNGMWVILFGSNIEGKEFNHFMTILLLDPYFKINGWIYRGILEILVKKLLNLISFPPISLKFRGNKIWGLKGIERNEYSLLPILFPLT